MDRRKFLALSTHSSLAALLVACGGGDDAAAPLPDHPNAVDPDEVILEEGVDPRSLSNLPSTQAADIEFLLQPIHHPVKASVFLGSQPQAGIQVDFYDLGNQYLGSAVTDISGMAYLEGVQARRFVLAEAHTRLGKLHGIKFMSDLMIHPEVYVDILQSSIVATANQLIEQQLEHSVSTFIVSDYFGVPREINLLNVGHNYRLCDQRLMFAEFQTSGQSLHAFTQSISQDIVDHMYELEYKNTKYSQPLLLRASSTSSDLISDIIGIAQTGLQEAIQLPFVSGIAGYAFGKLMKEFFPTTEVDPFDEVRSRLNEIDAKLDQIKDLINETNYQNKKAALAEKFLDFYTTIDLKNKADADNQHATDYAELYLKKLGSLTSDIYIDKYTHANYLFFGCAPYQPEASILDASFAVINKKFYSHTSQQQYQALLEYYIGMQAQAFLVLAGAYIYAEFIKPEAQRNTQQLSQKLERLRKDFADISRNVTYIASPSLPDRLNIDHKNKLAWVGACKNIEELKDLWPNDKTITYRIFSHTERICSPGDGPVNCRNVDIYDQIKHQGQGEKDWKGPIFSAHVVYQGPASMDATLFKMTGFAWRIPSLEEVKKSFLDDANKQNGDIVEYAMKNGFSEYSTLQKKTVSAFFNADKRNFADIPLRFRKAGGGVFSGAPYLDFTMVSFSNFKVVDSRKATTAYNQGADTNVLTCFPVSSVNDAFLDTYLPWRILAKVRTAQSSCTAR